MSCIHTISGPFRRRASFSFSSIRRKASGFHASEVRNPDSQQAGRWKCLLLPHVLSGDSVAVSGHRASVSAANRFASPGMPADAAAVIRIQIECLGGLRFAQLPIDSMRFYLDGESAVVHTLYELLFVNTLRIALRALPARDGTAQAVLPPSSLQPGRIHRRRGHFALLRPQLPWLSPAAGIFQFPGKVLLRRPDRPRSPPRGDLAMHSRF